MQYDGSINIDTRVDPKGMDAGIKNISAKFGRLLRTIQSFAQIAGAIIGRIFSLAALGLWFAAFQGTIKAIQTNLTSLFEKAGLKPQLDNIKNSFTELQFAVANAFLPLITAALPYVQQFTSWLITLFNKIAMITAALFGQKEVLQVIAGTVKNTGKEIEKSARGALATFDRLDVLDVQKDQPNVLSQVATELVPVESDIVDKIEAIKKKFADFKEWLIGLWDGIKAKIESVKKRLEEIGADLWKNFAVGGAIETIKQKWEQFKTWFNERVWQPLTQWASETWEKIKQWASEAKDTILEKWAGFTEWFADKWAKLQAGAAFMWERVKESAANAKESIIAAWQELSAWFGARVLQPLMNGFNFALEWIRSKFESIFTNLQTFVINILNNIIETINNALGGIFGGFASGGLALNFVSGGSKPNDTLAPRIPRLATGAVIPPNAEFAAILGDQRSGMNIETPVNLMRDTFDESLARALANQNINIRFTGSLAELVQILKPEIDRENVRVGSSLVSGGM